LKLVMWRTRHSSCFIFLPLSVVRVNAGRVVAAVVVAVVAVAGAAVVAAATDPRQQRCCLKVPRSKPNRRHPCV
jgi:hypothetical protein